MRRLLLWPPILSAMHKYVTSNIGIKASDHFWHIKPTMKENLNLWIFFFSLSREDKSQTLNLYNAINWNKRAGDTVDNKF